VCKIRSPIRVLGEREGVGRSRITGIEGPEERGKTHQGPHSGEYDSENQIVKVGERRKRPK